MNRSMFSALVRKGILAALDEFTKQHLTDQPYAFALIGGQCSNYLLYAIATEDGLRSTAEKYDRLGYQYQGWEWEEFDNKEKLSIWLRWANPDDGWHYGEFAESSDIQSALNKLLELRAFGDDAEDFEEACTEILSSLSTETAWERWSHHVTVGFTYGEDPRDFLRTATRTNPYPVVTSLWAQNFQADELSSRILSPKRRIP